MDCALDCLLDEGYDVSYARGYDKKTDSIDQTLMREAVMAAAGADVAVVFVGLTEEYEAEGFDRDSMNMPENHNALVKAVAAANPNTVVVLAGGAPVSMPWLDSAKALLNSSLGGQAGAAAVADILSGRVNPSGKLAETYKIYPNIGTLLPAMGYGDQQINDLAATIEKANCDSVVIATPIDLGRVIKINKPNTRVEYALQEIGRPDMADVLEPLISKIKK
jgi:hypothetical protein